MNPIVRRANDATAILIFMVSSTSALSFFGIFSKPTDADNSLIWINYPKFWECFGGRERIGQHADELIK